MIFAIQLKSPVPPLFSEQLIETAFVLHCVFVTVLVKLVRICVTDEKLLTFCQC